MINRFRTDSETFPSINLPPFEDPLDNSSNTKTLPCPHPAFGHLLPGDPNAGLKEKAECMMYSFSIREKVPDRVDG